MNNMTVTHPIEYIKLGDITYKVTPIKSNKHIQLVADFKKFLDKLHPEIYNKAVEEFGNSFSLKDFSDLIETDFTTDDKTLEQYIFIFKECVIENILKVLAELITLRDSIKEDLGIQLEPDHSLTNRMDNLIIEIYNIIKECEDNHLTDTQEFINFENALNTLSIQEHPEYRHEFKAESHIDD